MTPEQEILQDQLAQAAASAKSLGEALAMIVPFPADEATFLAMPPIASIASMALLKCVEQLEDGLARSFRAILKMLGVPTKGLYPLDIGQRMVELNVLDDAEAWLAVVKLRNELVHEYPLKPAERLRQLTRARDAIPLLLDARRRTADLVDARKWLDP